MVQSDFDALQSTKKSLPSIPEQAPQILQDFGAGSLLGWPLLHSAKDFDASWTDPPIFRVFLSGAVLFALGWLTRHLTRPANPTLLTRLASDKSNVYRIVE